MGAVAIGVVGQPHVATDDRLHAPATRSLIEADRPEHVGTVGQRDRALSIGSGPADGIIDANDAVDDRKLGVQTQVDELRSAHGEDSATRAARACG